MPRLSYYVNEDTHSTFVYMTLVIPRLSYYVSEIIGQTSNNNVMYTNVLRVCLH
jgi:hypothetical protein